jgi:hypothetical protein
MAQDPKTLTPAEVSSLSHFVAYGQPGTPSKKRVLPKDWRNLKPYVSPQTTPWSLAISASQLSVLVNGFKPREMEDKWFVCSEGKVEKGKIVLVHFYRSWTGHKISTVEMEVGKKGEGAKVKGLIWEKSEDVVKGQDLEGAKEGVREVCRWVLGVQLGADE